MPIPGKLLTAAMAVMPHTEVQRALKTALSLGHALLATTPKVKLL